jgi:hypothetical protein
VHSGQVLARLYWREFMLVGVIQFVFAVVSISGMLAMGELIKYGGVHEQAFVCLLSY